MGKGAARWKQLWIQVLDLLFPPRCPCCGAVTEEGAVCPDCERKLPWIEGDASVRVLEDGLLCCGPLWYEGVVREAILAMKFQGRSSGAKALGEWAASCAAEHFSGAFEVVTWVPVSQKRRRSRGYDQAELMARSACRLWETEPQPLLEKIQDNPAQSGLNDAAARRSNVQGAYRVREGRSVAGRRILLMDDVCTTGSTLSECADTLRAAGAAEVVCAVAALTRFPSRKRTRRNQEPAEP